MEEKIDVMIALLVEIRDALCGVEQDMDETPDQRCPCTRATGSAIGNCPFCRGGG